MSLKRFVPLFFAAFMILSGPLTTQAADDLSNTTSTYVSDSVCDPSVFDRMRQKAWMEAERENYINQTNILRPESGSTLTCFDKQVGLSMSQGCVKEKTGTTDDTTRCEQAMQNTAGKVSNGLIGSTSGGKPLENPDPNSGSTVTYGDYKATPAKSDDFSCDEMNKLWTNAQCGNLAGGKLPSLKEVGSGDELRKYPAACSTTRDDKTGDSSNYTYANGIKSINGTVGAGTTGFNNLDLHRCNTMSYSELEAATDPSCPNDPTTGNKCRAVMTGRKTSTGPLEAFCPNDGCVLKADGDKMTCGPPS